MRPRGAKCSAPGARGTTLAAPGDPAVTFFPPHAFPTRGQPAAPGQVNPARTRLAQELRHNSPLFSCRFDPAGRFVFAGAQDNAIHRWELATSRRVALTGHRSWVRALAFLPEPR